jgi:hypothetical protein
MNLSLTCSAKPKARVQRGAKGHAGWDREPFHIQRSGITTLCGRDCSEWLRIGEREAHEAIRDPGCCRRCARKAEFMQALPSSKSAMRL